MLAYYLISIDNVPYKLYKSRKAVDDTIDWFIRMSQYDRSEYRDYDKFSKTGLSFWNEYDVETRVRVTLVEVEE